MTDHERGYINGLEDWVLRVEAENNKLRDELAELREKPQGFLNQVVSVLKRKPVDGELCPLAFHAKIVVDTVDEQKLVIEKQDTEIGILRDKVETQRRTISQIRAALERKPLPQDGAPVHPLTERALTLVNYVDQWEVVAGWVIDNLNVGRGELSSSHMITMFQAQKVEIDKLKADNYTARVTLELCREWLEGRARNTTLAAMLDSINKALK